MVINCTSPRSGVVGQHPFHPWPLFFGVCKWGYYPVIYGLYREYVGMALTKLGPILQGRYLSPLPPPPTPLFPSCHHRCDPPCDAIDSSTQQRSHANRNHLSHSRTKITWESCSEKTTWNIDGTKLKNIHRWQHVQTLLGGWYVMVLYEAATFLSDTLWMWSHFSISCPTDHPSLYLPAVAHNLHPQTHPKQCIWSNHPPKITKNIFASTGFCSQNG